MLKKVYFFLVPSMSYQRSGRTFLSFHIKGKGTSVHMQQTAHTCMPKCSSASCMDL